ncbi:DUF3883 domain-containing protein [Flavobacterium sp. SORGH_AS_0622]|uniref:DUF3883 domain-containing protein n=1 Tax=Flavobacterium sp. SORGH_AS_0622 TaxID=3041772 RepID=UPI00278A1641|nr:DUF3883 domain-containing protein [Flavobacterium sp. SORGH_AS_0622]MDQ1164605.1 hypothetical protein [Flavobacterium sp. SORGH_AS_0622]
MNLDDLRQAQVRYLKRIDRIIEERENLHKIRSQFIKYFKYSRIHAMQIDEFVLGRPPVPGSYNFCYTIERELDGLGRIIGANAFKFGVYYGKIKSDSEIKYRFAKKYGNNHAAAFENVRTKILELLDSGAVQDFNAIARNHLSPMFKGKILSTYFPDIYLNVFSPEHLNYFLIKLDLDNKLLIKQDAVFKRNALLEFKNKDLIMRHWPVDIFADFLYTEYPGRPFTKTNENEDSAILQDYLDPQFPSNPEASFIELGIMPSNFSLPIAPGKKVKIKGKKNYEAEGRRLRKLGDRGEKIVMDLEAKRLREGGRMDLVELIDRVSLKSDSYGYDILSYELDGRKRYIEVKATTGEKGDANFFLSSNELQVAEVSENYYIYMVYDVTTKSPKVWPIPNPFKTPNDGVKKTAVTYWININTSLKL